MKQPSKYVSEHTYRVKTSTTGPFEPEYDNMFLAITHRSFILFISIRNNSGLKITMYCSFNW